MATIHFFKHLIRNSINICSMSKIVPLDEMALKMRKRKRTIPKAVREQLWLRDMGKAFQGKCMTSWCMNTISIFDFQCGHNIPESKGGPTTLENLVPICSRCNTSMGSQYSFVEWSRQHAYVKKTFWQKMIGCFIKN